ncbi:hypothetical protein [Paenibacillus sp. Marseille-Q4541]|uniref:hypothetical protein n=1 Tax=Paenibacillus sp. Marseille-Q4541 TaxID=2831522 RepID=UPI001BAB5521|nr:hypothetical protein [Paenibacillus sp. Marseille-Q4541]
MNCIRANHLLPAVEAILLRPLLPVLVQLPQLLPQASLGLDRLLINSSIIVNRAPLTFSRFLLLLLFFATGRHPLYTKKPALS